jgi:hypothetical protein
VVGYYLDRYLVELMRNFTIINIYDKLQEVQMYHGGVAEFVYYHGSIQKFIRGKINEI